MSDHHLEHDHDDHHHGPVLAWYDRYWQVLVIAFGVCFVVLLFSYGPVTAPGENGHVSTGSAAHKQAQEVPAAVQTQ